MTIKNRFISALGANINAQVVTLLIQILSIPIFLDSWSVEQYGVWLLLSTIPAYFALADFGFIAVAINKMTIMQAAGDQNRVQVIFQSALKLWIFVLIAVAFLVTLFAFGSQWSVIESIENKMALILLSIGAIVSMSSALVDGIFRANGQFAIGANLGSVSRLIEWGGLIIGLTAGGNFLSAAIGQFVGCLISFIIKLWASTIRYPQIKWQISRASKKEVQELLRPAASFMSFTAGNALSIQGMILVVGSQFGPAMLVVFNTYRTIARIQVQLMSLVGKSLWPELSRQYGLGNVNVLVTLTKRGTLMSLALALCSSLFLLVFGETLLRIWTENRVPYYPHIFNALLVPTFLLGTWQMMMVTLSSTNNHSCLAVPYLSASIASLIIGFTMSKWLGIYSVVVGLIVFELAILIACWVGFNLFKSKNLKFRLSSNE